MLSSSCFAVCGHHLPPRIAIAFSLLSSAPKFSISHVRQAGRCWVPFFSRSEPLGRATTLFLAVLSFKRFFFLFPDRHCNCHGIVIVIVFTLPAPATIFFFKSSFYMKYETTCPRKWGESPYRRTGLYHSINQSWTWCMDTNVNFDGACCASKPWCCYSYCRYILECWRQGCGLELLVCLAISLDKQVPGSS